MSPQRAGLEAGRCSARTARAALCICAAHITASLAAPPGDENFEHAFSTADYTTPWRQIDRTEGTLLHACTHLHAQRALHACCILHHTPHPPPSPPLRHRRTILQTLQLSDTRPLLPLPPPLHSLATAAGTFSSRQTPSPTSRGRMRSARRPRVPLATCTLRRCPPHQTRRR